MLERTKMVKCSHNGYTDHLRVLQALRGSDVVGSSVRLKLRKPSGKFFECTIQRGSIARIEAIGELFLMLTEVSGDIQHQKKISVDDIMRYMVEQITRAESFFGGVQRGR